MPQEPKRRHSKARKGKRRASIHLQIPRVLTCKNCGSSILSHTVCANCGYYKGKQVVAVKSKKNENPA